MYHESIKSIVQSNAQSRKKIFCTLIKYGKRISMCGICGYLANKQIEYDDLVMMNDTMKHRGPDDHGEEIIQLESGKYLGLAQRRLSIVDLSILGHQPMHTNDDRLLLVFNGEIYNFRELKKELCADYQFKSECDTEVILAAYLKWGTQCFEKFNGMFSIAIYDRATEELILARDRMGKKPLYYYFDAECFIFASECKPIEKFPGLNCKINQNVIGYYLYHQYIREPYTIYEHLFKVCPGEMIIYKNGELKSNFYWRATLVSNSTHVEKMSYEDAKSELKKLLYDSVSKRLVADVPIGTFLSGGYDSTLVTAIAQDISKSPIKTFCIGFDDAAFNEATYAKSVSHILGTDHTELYISDKHMLNLIDDIPYYYDEPFADSSQIPSMLVAELARKDVKVVLTGDGGDELFCGYNAYDSYRKEQIIHPIALALNAVIDNKVTSAFNIKQHLPHRVVSILNNNDKRFLVQRNSMAYNSIINEILSDNKNMLSLQNDESLIKDKNWQRRGMLLDQVTYLPGDILCKVDRATMKYSLEGRCPLLDYRIVEFSYKVPHQYLYQFGNKKRIIKDLVYEYVPKEIMERPKKGFSVPLERWLKGPLKGQLLDYVNTERATCNGIYNPKKIRELVNNYYGNSELDNRVNYTGLLWSLFVFYKWLNRG